MWFENVAVCNCVYRKVMFLQWAWNEVRIDKYDLDSTHGGENIIFEDNKGKMSGV